MKYLLFSDIHGCLPALEKVLDFFEAEHCDMMCIMGDIINYGPRNRIPEGIDPKGIVERLNALADKIIAVRGNCDAEVDQMVLDFPILADYAVLPVGRRLVYATHGHVHNLKNLPPLAPGDVLLHGHTHIPAWPEFGEGNLYLNPGSVSIPKEGSAHSYMTLEGETFLWKTLEGEVYRELEL